MLLSAPCIKLQAQVNIITTICGNDTAGYSGDDGPAVLAKLQYPEGLCLDNFNNLYIADPGDNRIRKINLATGVITTVAGNGSIGFSGDSGPAKDATVGQPVDVFTDAVGNVYIADALNNRIRKITVGTGIITTIAGKNISGSYGDGGPATNAALKLPCGVCIDKLGNILIADYDNHKVRKVDAVTGIIKTIAGTGTAGGFGNGGPATSARLNGPIQVFTDTLGNVFICDQFNHAVRKVDTAGIISVIAGFNGAGYSGDGGPATNAKLNEPAGGYVDQQHNIYVIEYRNGTIRRIDAITNMITTVVGMGTTGFAGDGTPATNAKLKATDIFADSIGTIYIADIDNHRIRKVYDPTLAIKPVGIVQTISIYPNPAQNELTIEGAQNTTMVLCDVVGKVVMERKINSDKETIDISTLSNSVYVLQVHDAVHNTRIMTKLVVAR